jgi:hypothetical protein
MDLASYPGRTTRSPPASPRRLLSLAARVWFALSLLAVAFAAGLAVARWQLPPYEFVQNGALAIRDWVANGRGYLRGEPVKHIRPARHPGAGVVLADLVHMAPGPTFISGAWKTEDGWTIGLRLLSPGGEVLREWRIDPAKAWPRSPKDLSKTQMDRVHIHGAELLPDGHVVFNLEYLGFINLDACSKISWKLDYNAHHSVQRVTDGSFWVGGRKLGSDKRYPGLPVPHTDETILHVGPDGRLLREISVLDAIYRSGHEGILFATRQDKAVGMREDNAGDLMRLNDVEVLEPHLAPAFPMFAAGDIMISLRQINAILVIDGKAETVKWAVTHAAVRQHDPDFNPDGSITVFDNRKDETANGDILGGSRIVRIDPATRAVTILYPQRQPDPRFFTNVMGKHQVLPNGNLLLAEAESGRAIEVTAAGEPVWSYVNRWDERRVGLVEQATRYPPGYLAQPLPACR